MTAIKANTHRKIDFRVISSEPKAVVLPQPRKLQHFEVYETSPHARPILDGIQLKGWLFKREVQILVAGGQWLARVSQRAVVRQ